MREKTKQSLDKDLAGAEAALRRAAKRARTIAEETKTPLIFYKNGNVVKEFPTKAKVKQAS